MSPDLGLIEGDSVGGARDAWTLQAAYCAMIKLNVYHGQDLGELYDLAEDPHEFVDRWDDPAWQARKLDLMQRSFNASMLAMDRGPRWIRPM